MRTIGLAPRLRINSCWTVVAVAIVPLAIAAGVVAGSDPLHLVAVVLGVISVLALLRYPKLLLFVAMVSYGVSYRTMMEYRIFVGTWPVALYDVMALLLFASGVVALRRKRVLTFGRMGSWLLLTFVAFFTFVAIPIGLYNGTSLYNVVQNYRGVFYALVAFWATLVLVRGDDEIRSIVLGGIVGAVLAVAQILWSSYLSIPFSSPEVILRDYWLPVGYAVMGLCILGSLWLWHPAFLGRMKILLLLFAMVGGIVFANFRTYLFMVLACVAILVWFAPKSRRTYQLLVILAALMITVFFLLPRISPYFQDAVGQVTVRLNATFSSADETWLGRLSVTDVNLKIWQANVVSVLIGSGWGSADAHNGYTYVLATGGLIGFVLFMGLVLYFFSQSVRALHAAHTDFHKAVAALIIASLSAYYISAVSTGGFLGSTSALHWGTLCGLAEFLVAEHVLPKPEHQAQ